MKNFSGHTFCFLGRSGAGKDSQANLLQAFLEKEGYKVSRISTSNEARKLIAKDTAVGRWLKEILDRGDFFPDWITISLWMAVIQNEIKGDEVLIFSSSPRKLAEVYVLDDFSRATHRPMPVIVNLEISDDESMGRLIKRGRDDDSPGVISERLSCFKRDVLPVLGYYGNRLLTVDGNGTVEDVNKRMMEKILAE